MAHAGRGKEVAECMWAGVKVEGWPGAVVSVCMSRGASYKKGCNTGLSAIKSLESTA